MGLLHETYTSRLGVFGASASLTVLSIGGESVSLDALRGVLQLALPDNRNSSRCDALILLILSPEKFDRAFNHVIREAVLAHFARPVEIFTEHLTNQDKAREIT